MYPCQRDIIEEKLCNGSGITVYIVHETGHRLQAGIMIPVHRDKILTVLHNINTPDADLAVIVLKRQSHMGKLSYARHAT